MCKSIPSVTGNIIIIIFLSPFETLGHTVILECFLRGLKSAREINT